MVMKSLAKLPSYLFFTDIVPKMEKNEDFALLVTVSPDLDSVSVRNLKTYKYSYRDLFL